VVNEISPARDPINQTRLQVLQVTPATGMIADQGTEGLAMIDIVKRALARRRAIRDTVQRLIDQMAEGAWAHARDRAFASQTQEDRTFWHKVQGRIEAHDDRTTRMSIRRRARG
jgi:hypothetical protein